MTNCQNPLAVAILTARGQDNDGRRSTASVATVAAFHYNNVCVSPLNLLNLSHSSSFKTGSCSFISPHFPALFFLTSPTFSVRNATPPYFPSTPLIQLIMSLKAELETWAAALKAYDAEDFEKSLELFAVRTSISFQTPPYMCSSSYYRVSQIRPRYLLTWDSSMRL